MEKTENPQFLWFRDYPTCPWDPKPSIFILCLETPGYLDESKNESQIISNKYVLYIPEKEIDMF